MRESSGAGSADDEVGGRDEVVLEDGGEDAGAEVAGGGGEDEFGHCVEVRLYFTGLSFEHVEYMRRAVYGVGVHVGNIQKTFNCRSISHQSSTFPMSIGFCLM